MSVSQGGHRFRRDPALKIIREPYEDSSIDPIEAASTDSEPLAEETTPREPQSEHHLSTDVQARTMRALLYMADVLFNRSEEEADPLDCERLVALSRAALRFCPPGHPSRRDCLIYLVDSLHLRDQELHEDRTLDEYITMHRQILQLYTPDYQDYIHRIAELASSLQVRFDRHAGDTDMDEHIQMHSQVLELCARDHPDRLDSVYNLASGLRARFISRHLREDLERSMSLYRELLKTYPQDDEDYIICLDDLADCLWTCFSDCAAAASLDECIQLHRQVLHLSADTSHHNATVINKLAIALRTRFEERGNQEDLNESICLSRQSLQLSASVDEDRVSYLSTLGSSLCIFANETGSQALLDEAIDLHRQALSLREIGSVDRFDNLNDLANSLTARFDLCGILEDLENSIQLRREALELCSESQERRSICLTNLADDLRNRYEQCGADADLAESIALSRQALDLRFNDDPMRPSTMNVLALALHTHFERHCLPHVLEEAISLLRDVLVLRPPGHPARASNLNSLSNAIHARFQRFGADADIDEAISCAREALNLWKHDHPDRVISLENLAQSLRSHYIRHKAETSLNESISIYHEIIEMHPRGHPRRLEDINNIAIALWLYHTLRGKDETLDELISFHHEALSLCQVENPLRALTLSNYSRTMLALFNRNGEENVLDEAIGISREALQLTPKSSNARASRLNGLAVSLLTRFDRRGRNEDLAESVAISREALKVCPDGPPERYMLLVNLASALHLQFKRHHVDEDLDEAIALQYTALDIHLYGHPNRITGLVNLANFLRSRFDSRGSSEDLEKSIVIRREALQFCSENERVMCLYDLASSLVTSFSRAEATLWLEESCEQRAGQAQTCSHEFSSWVLTCRQDRNEAQRLFEEALSLSPHGHPKRPIILFGLSIVFAIPNTNHHNLQRAFRLLADGLQDISCSARHRLLCARQALHTLSLSASSNKSPNVIKILLEAHTLVINFFPDVLIVAETLRQQLEELKDADGLASLAASYAVLDGRVDLAVELLEGGRATIWSQSLRLRMNLDAVPARFRAEIMNLSSKLESAALSSTISREHSIAEEDTTRVQMQERMRYHTLVTKIRSQPGLDDFMRLDSFVKLSQSAKYGPIVMLNSSSVSCEALLIEGPARSRQLPLAISMNQLTLLSQSMALFLDENRRQQKGDNESEIDQACETNSSSKPFAVLQELWTHIVQPVIRALDLKRPTSLRKRPRLWWCLSGDFTFLPVHAAGVYNQGNSENILTEESCSDYVVSSYIPTLSALSRARNYHAVQKSQAKLLLAAVPQAYDQTIWSPIPGTRREAHAVKAIVPDHVLLPLLETDDCTCNRNSGATVSAVQDGLETAHILHLACHGYQDPSDPLLSGFAMRDGMLTIEKLMNIPCPNAFFAFLSACDTAKGDSRQPDQVIHLAATMLFVGFKSVVGTLWSVGDQYAANVATFVYRRLFHKSGDVLDPTVIPYALDEAMRRLRKDNPHPAVWATYCHIGI